MVKSSSTKNVNQIDQNSNLIPSFQHLVETAMEGVWVTNKQDITTYVNKSLCNLLGYEENEILQHPASKFLFAEDIKDYDQRIVDRKSGKTDTYERRLKKKDGTPVWMMLSAKPLYDENAAFAGSFVHLIDISDKKRRDRLIQLVAETQFSLAQISDIDEVYNLVGRKIKEMIPEGIVGTTSVDENRQVMTISNLYGIGQSFFDLVNKFNIDPRKITYPLKDAPLYTLEMFNFGKLQLYEGGLYRLLMKKVPKAVCKVVEKQLHINQIRMMGLVSEGKHFGGIVVISEGDLSIYTTAIESVVYQATQVIKRLRAEKVRALSEARLRSTFDAIEDGYWDWDIATGKIETNDKWFTMLGYQPNEFIVTYENFIKLVHPQDINNTKQHIEASIQNRDLHYNIEFRLRMKSGEYKYVQSRGKFIRIVGDEKPIRMVGTHTDISDRKRLEEDRLLFFDTQRKLLQVTTLEELNDLAGNCLLKLIQNGFVTISKVDELSRTTKVVGFFGFSGAIEELLNRYRLSISRFATRLDEIEPEDLKMWQSNTLVKYEKGIYGIVNKKIPKKICQLIEKNLGINEIYVMGCQLKSNDFGGFVLLTKTGLGQNRELIETLINDTAIAIQRILTENESRETQTRYQSIYKESPVGIVTVGADLKFISANAEFCRFIGYSENELINIRFTDITHPENLNRDSENIKKLLADEISVYNTIKKYIRKDGDVVSAKVVVNKICDPQRNLIYFLAMVTDITRELAVEEAIKENQKFLEIVLNTIPNFVFVRDIEGRYQLSNKAFADAMGSTAQEIIGVSDQILREEENLDNKVRLQDIEILRTGKDWIEPDVELSFPKIGKLPVHFIKRALPVIENKTPAVLGVITDISERKQIEQEIRNREEKYRTLFTTMRQGAFYQDIDKNILEINPAALEIFGLTEEEFDSGLLADFSASMFDENGVKIDISDLPSNIAAKTRKPVVGRTISFINHKTNKETWIVVDAIPQFRENEQNPYQVFVTLNDITLLKQIEKELRNSELRYRTLIQNSPAGIYQADVTGKTTYSNEKLCNLTGLDFDALIGNGWTNAIHPDDKGDVVHRWQAFMQNGGRWTSEYRQLNQKTGQVSWVYDEAVELLNEEGMRIGFIGSVVDLTEQKNAENSLRKNEEKYRLLAENMKDVIWTLDTETMQITYMSPSIEKLRGYTVEEAMAQGIDHKLLNASSETINKVMKHQIAEFLKDPNGPDKYYTQEYKQLKKDGSTIWTEIITNYFLNQETGHVELKGVSRDISERKQSELERQSLFEIMQGLSRSNNLDQFLQLIHQVLLKIIDARNISIVFFNKETGLFEEIYCIDEFDKPYPPSKLEKSITSYVFRTGKSVILGDKAFKQLTKMGEVRLVVSPSAVWMGAPIKDADDVIGVIAVQNYGDENAYSERDKEFLSSVAAQVAVAIKQKRAEEAIQRSEEKHRLLIENSHDIIYTLNLEGKFTFVSNAWSAFLGYPTGEIVGQLLSRFLITKSRRTFQEFFNTTIQSGQSQKGVEYQIKHADGSWRWHTTNAVPIKNTDGICIGIEGTAQDITERKMTEAALHESEERYRVLVENSPIGIMLTQKGKLIYANTAGVNLYGFKHMDEMLGRKMKSMIHPDSYKVLLKRILELQKRKENSLLELMIIKENGDICATESISSQVKINGENTTLIFAQDISARKAAEDKIRKNTEDLTLLQKLNDLVNQGGSLQKCMELINEETRKYLSGNGASVYLLDSEKEYLELQSNQLPNETILGIENKIGFKIPKVKIKLNPNSNYHKILTGKKPQYFEGPDQVMGLMLEFTTSQTLKKLIPELYKQIGIVSVIAIPLIVQNESVGLLEFSSKTSYKKEDLNRFEFLALELASVIRRKQAEEALKDSEAKFRQIVEKSNDIFLLEDFNTLGIEYISPKIHDLLGYPQSDFFEATREQIVEIIHPDDLHIFDGFRQNLVQTWQTGQKNVVVEFRVKSTAGEYKWFTGNYSLVVDDNSEPKSIMSTLTDITERKLNELSLRFRVKLMQLAPQLSMNELLIAVLDEVEEITNSRFGFYHFVDQDESSMSLMAWSTNTMSQADGVLSGENAHAIEQKGVWLECLQQRRPVIHNEPESITPYDKNIEKHLHIFRELAIPVMRKDKIVSVLGLGNKSSNYTLGDLELVSKLADMVWDVIENKKIESELKESEAIFSAFMENSPIFVFFKDKEGRSIQLSRNYETVLGKPVDKLLHKRMDEIFPPRIAHKMTEDDLQVIKDGKASVIDEELGGRTYSTIRFPVVKEGLPEFLAGFSIDITDRVLSQKKLAESEEMYRLISSVVSDYLFSTRVTDDGTLDLNWVAGAFEKITGYTMAEYKQMGGWKAALYPGDFETDNHDMQMLNLNQKVITELRTIRKNGEVVWVRVYSQPIWDEEHNRLVGINGAVQDITDRKKVEEEINKSVEEFKALYDTAIDFSLHRDPEVILKTIADRASSLFAASNAFVYLYNLNKNNLELKFTKNHVQPLGTYVNMGEGISGLVAEKLSPMMIPDYSKWEGRRQDSTFDSVAAIMCVPMLYGGQLLGVLGVHENHPSELAYSEEDVHFLTLFASQAAAALYSADLFEKIRQNANELEKRVDERTKELKLKNKELETFTYTVSHDLKAPLRGISGYATLLKEDYSNQLDSEARRYLENLVNSSELMSQLIEDLLAYSRVERREIKKTNINLDMLVDKITEEYKHGVVTGKLNFKKEIEYGTVFTDEEALNQALRNLIDNAVKFTRDQSDPEIWIRSTKLEDHCLISIEDNGIGFDMKYYDKIFEIFQRLHLSEDYPGTGIGLAVVRKAVERLGGKIWAVSQPGEGSTFFMELPL